MADQALTPGVACTISLENLELTQEKLGSGASASIYLAKCAQGGQYAVKVYSKSNLRRRQKYAQIRARSASRSPGMNGMTSPPLRQPGKIKRGGYFSENGALAGLRDPDGSERHRDNRNSPDSLDAILPTEIAILKRLTGHPNIVTLMGVLDVPKLDSIYVVTEVCRNGPLLIERQGEVCGPGCDCGASDSGELFFTNSRHTRYPLDVCQKYFRQLVMGVRFLHENNIMHLDLKPENVLLTSEYEVLKIIDFSSARFFDLALPEQDYVQEATGTPYFLSSELVTLTTGIRRPETPPGSEPSAGLAGNGVESRVQGNRTLNINNLRLNISVGVSGRKCDIWALGAILYCILFFRLPFPGSEEAEVYEAIVLKDIVIPEPIPAEVEKLLSHLLEKSPEYRISMERLCSHSWVL